MPGKDPLANVKGVDVAWMRQFAFSITTPDDSIPESGKRHASNASTSYTEDDITVVRALRLSIHSHKRHE